MVTPAAKRKAVAHLRDAFGMSERRACKAIGCCRMTMRYQTTRADDAGIRQRMTGDRHLTWADQARVEWHYIAPGQTHAERLH